MPPSFSACPTALPSTDTAPPFGAAPSATTTIENFAPRRSRWAIVAATGSRSNGISGMRMAWAPDAAPALSAIHPA